MIFLTREVCSVPRTLTIPVSYTHLDVYKRQLVSIVLQEAELYALAGKDQEVEIGTSGCYLGCRYPFLLPRIVYISQDKQFAYYIPARYKKRGSCQAGDLHFTITVSVVFFAYLVQALVP